MCRTTAVRHSGAPLSAACQRRHYVRKNRNQNGCLRFCPAGQPGPEGPPRPGRPERHEPHPPRGVDQKDAPRRPGRTWRHVARHVPGAADPGAEPVLQRHRLRATLDANSPKPGVGRRAGGARAGQRNASRGRPAWRRRPSAQPRRFAVGHRVRPFAPPTTGRLTR